LELTGACDIVIANAGITLFYTSILRDTGISRHDFNVSRTYPYKVKQYSLL